MITIFMIVLSVSGGFFYAENTHNKGKQIGKFFMWLPIANFIFSITSILLTRQVSIWNG